MALKENGESIVAYRVVRCSEEDTDRCMALYFEKTSEEAIDYFGSLTMRLQDLCLSSMLSIRLFFHLLVLVVLAGQRFNI